MNGPSRPHGKPHARMNSRRRFLFAAGAAALAPSLLGADAVASPSSSAAASEDGASPLRFIGVYMPHGSAYELWKPGPDFDIRYEDCSLSPFDAPDIYGRSFKDVLLVVDGLDLAAGIETGTVGHDASRVILTGSGADGSTPSIDQYLAQEHLLGAQTPLTSIALSIGNDKTDLGQNVSYARGGTPVPKWIDPAQVFDELFGKPLSDRDRAALEAQRARQRSVLDFVRRDLQRLHQRAPAAERVKMQQHHTALREIEKRISPPKRVCAAPARPDPLAFPKLHAFGGGEPYFETITELMTDLLALALACDITRFATLMLADLTRARLYPGLPDDIHQDVAHRYWAATNASGGRPQTWRALALQNRHTHGHIARLLQRLDSAGALQDTLVFAQSDMGDPSRHSSKNVPTLIAGGCGGHFSMGRHVDLRSSKGTELLPSNRALVSICQAFGIAVDRFGHSANAATVTGALPELHG